MTKFARIDDSARVVAISERSADERFPRIVPVPDDAVVGGLVTFGYVAPTAEELAAKADAERKAQTLTIGELEAAGFEGVRKQDGSIEIKEKGNIVR